MKTFALVIATSISVALANSEAVVAREEGTHLRRMEGMPSPPQYQMPNEAAQTQQRNPNGNREQWWGPGLYGGGFYGGGLYDYPYGGYYGGGFYY